MIQSRKIGWTVEQTVIIKLHQQAKMYELQAIVLHGPLRIECEASFPLSTIFSKCSPPYQKATNLRLEPPLFLIIMLWFQHYMLHVVR